MGANTLQEFLNENLHRNYPILDSGDARDVTGTYNLPTELMADMRLVVPDGAVAGGTFFISGVIVRRYTADIEVSYKPTGLSAIVVGWFHNIDTDANTFQEYSFVTVPQTDPTYVTFEDVTGLLVAGIGLASITLPGSWSFGETNTPLVATATSEQLTKFRSVQVGDEVFTGNIVIEEGDNVTITTSYDAGTDTTTINIAAREVTTTSVTLVDDDSLITALAEIYGPPITRINELSPVDGNFQLQGSDCVEVATEGASGLRITNPCGEPCCDKESYLTPVYDSLNQLNARHVRLEDFLSGAVVNLDTLISRLKDLENSVGIGGF